uniref:Enhancer of polycomb-like protein n=2 Tax=Oryza brachyantha TaxID=4533 RepID=J3L8N7_ORYBR
MPHVGARRSTRVFVPKTPRPPQPSDPARVLRSGKRLGFSESPADAHWFHWDTRKPKNCFHVDDHQRQHHKDPKPPPPRTGSFGIVYSRKRRRRPPEPKENTRFAIVFSRKNKRPKVAPFRQHSPNDLATIPCSSSREFATRTGFLDSHFYTLVDCIQTHTEAVMLIVLVDSSCSGSSQHFLRLLLPVLRWMRRCRRGKVRNLASFLSSDAVATAFALHGLHFVQLQCHTDCALSQRTLVQCGWCELRSAKDSEPLLSVNFLAVPSYFQTLHLLMAIESMYLPAVIRQRMHLAGGAEEIYPHTLLNEDSESLSTVDAQPAVDLCRNKNCSMVQDYVPLEEVAGVVVHGVRLKKHQRKRSSMRHPLSQERLAARFPDKVVAMKQTAVASQTEVGAPPSASQELLLEPLKPKAALEISLDLLENMDDSDVSTPIGSNGKQKRSSLKSPIERMNERLALAEVRQNIDSVHCRANLLIIQPDRCWREEGAEVLLEPSGSNEWCIAVKIHGINRISLKPSEHRFYVVNRFTHAYILAVDDGLKLEFSDKWDWLLFKELQIEGRERNSQGKMIPIPGVHEISDDMGVIVAYPFSRPLPDYIRMTDDEVGRALSKDCAYDLDSEDEQWLTQLSHSESDRESSQLNHISYEDFEKIITTFEKDAFNNPEGTSDVNQILSRCPTLEKDHNVLAVYEYWIHKRYKKGAPLLRILQGATLRRGQLSQRSIKKRRSFKRQRSQTGRGKPEIFLQDNAVEEEALRRVVEAERVAKQAGETAVRLRSRAQCLMAKAELVTYKSVMALRIAEAARISDSSRDLVLTTLDSPTTS